MGDIAVIQMKDIDDANLLHADNAVRVVLPRAQPRHLLRVGDVLFRSRGRSNGAAQVQVDIGAAVLAAPMLLIRPHGALPEYLCWYINSPAVQAQFAALSEGTSVRMISAEALRSLDVPLPALAVQQRIVQAAALAGKEQFLQTRIATLRHRLTYDLLMKTARENTP